MLKKLGHLIQKPFIALEEFMEKGGMIKDIILLSISAVAVICSLIFSSVGIAMSFDWAWIAVILCGIPIVCEALCGLILRGDIRADLLVSLALIASLLTKEYFAAGEVAVIMQLGGFLEEVTVHKAHAGIEKLVKLTPLKARVLKDNSESEIAVEDVNVGDILKVLPGETIPVDGVILEGHTAINQAVMTGESLPVDKTQGDEVFSGTVNQFGVFTMKATKVGEDSSIQRMIKLVQSADASKAKIVGLADRWATWVVVIALVAAALTWIISGEIMRAVTILVVFCPCSLVLATPTAIMAAIGNVTKHGFLVRNGDALERLAKCDMMTFDKTGTLTYGTPEVITIKSLSQDIPSEELYAYVATAEHNSEHPLGQAIVKGYEKTYGALPYKTTSFTMTPGEGIEAVINNHTVLAGNDKLLNHHQVNFDKTLLASYLAQGATGIYIALDHVFVGYIVLADNIRQEAPAMMAVLKEHAIEPVLLTGDHLEAAQSVASKAGITTFKSDCLPEDKMAYIQNNIKEGHKVCMLGDGINDAPALKSASVGIAMGGIGSDIAIDASDIVLVNDDVKELPHLVLLSRHMMTIIKINLTFSMTLNFVAIVLAILAVLNPVVGALVHNAGSVLVIVNSAFLLSWKKRNK